MSPYVVPRFCVCGGVHMCACECGVRVYVVCACVCVASEGMHWNTTAKEQVDTGLHFRRKVRIVRGTTGRKQGRGRVDVRLSELRAGLACHPRHESGKAGGAAGAPISAHTGVVAAMSRVGLRTHARDCRKKERASSCARSGHRHHGAQCGWAELRHTRLVAAVSSSTPCAMVTNYYYYQNLHRTLLRICTAAGSAARARAWGPSASKQKLPHRGKLGGSVECSNGILSVQACAEKGGAEGLCLHAVLEGAHGKQARRSQQVLAVAGLGKCGGDGRFATRRRVPGLTANVNTRQASARPRSQRTPPPSRAS